MQHLENMEGEGEGGPPILNRVELSVPYLICDGIINRTGLVTGLVTGVGFLIVRTMQKHNIYEILNFHV